MRGGYTQVPCDFMSDSIKKPVLTGTPPVFLLFILPCLIDTLHVWYHWIGIFKAHGPFSIDHIGIYQNTFTDLSLSNTPVLYPRFSLSGPSPSYYSSQQPTL